VAAPERGRHIIEVSLTTLDGLHRQTRPSGHIHVIKSIPKGMILRDAGAEGLLRPVPLRGAVRIWPALAQSGCVLAQRDGIRAWPRLPARRVTADAVDDGFIAAEMGTQALNQRVLAIHYQLSAQFPARPKVQKPPQLPKPLPASDALQQPIAPNRRSRPSPSAQRTVYGAVSVSGHTVLNAVGNTRLKVFDCLVEPLVQLDHWLPAQHFRAFEISRRAASDRPEQGLSTSSELEFTLKASLRQFSDGEIVGVTKD
jgi:hypothetical protein